MASLNPEIAGAEVEGVQEIASAPRIGRRHRFRVWRAVVLVVAGAYFLLPLYAGVQWSLQNDAGHFSLYAVRAIPSEVGFADAFFLSLRLALATVVIALALMVPTVVYVHLKMPKMRKVMEVVTILPIVIPPIVLIIPFTQVAPNWLRSTPYFLSLMYVILAMPFVYRSLDAGLNAIDLKTLVEASRSLGARWISTLWRVVMPNLRQALLSAAVLTIALALGEFTMASLDLWSTLPVWIAQFAQVDSHVATAVSMLSLIGTWLLLTALVSLDRSHSRRTRGRTDAS